MEWYIEALNQLQCTIDCYPNSPCPWESWEECVRQDVRGVLNCYSRAVLGDDDYV